jgi:hypothetical protein
MKIENYVNTQSEETENKADFAAILQRRKAEEMKKNQKTKIVIKVGLIFSDYIKLC